MAGEPSRRIAFVLGGGGALGACEVGMLAALVDAGIRPDLVLGTSIGAVNGAVFAAEPGERTVQRLRDVWGGIDRTGVLGGSIVERVTNLARTRIALHSAEPLRQMLEDALPGNRIEDLAVHFECVAASIEHAREHWFTEGPLVDAVLASSALPGVLPPVEIDGEHFIDGGIVNSIPVGRAALLGATEIYVLQVGRIERPLDPPRRLWDVGFVAFEVARRHRFASDMAALPDGVTAHVLPTGDDSPPRYNEVSQLRYRKFAGAAERIERAHEATTAYLRERRAA